MKTLGMTLEEWKKRKDYLGGSDISIIMDQNKYKGSYSLWEEKMGLHIPTDLDEPSEYIKAGHVFEPVIKILFQLIMKDKGFDLEYESDKYHSLADPEHAFLRSHPDGVLNNFEGMDAKVTNSRSFFNRWGDDKMNAKVPTEYVYQGIYNNGIIMLNTNVIPKKFYFAVWKATGKDYKVAEQLWDRNEPASLYNLMEFYLTDGDSKTLKERAMNNYERLRARGEDPDFAEIIMNLKLKKLYQKLSTKISIRSIDFRKEYFERLKKYAIDWWDKHIINEEKPPISFKEREYLREKYKFAKEGATEIIGEELDKLVSERNSTFVRLKRAEHALKQTEEYQDVEKLKEYTAFTEAKILEKMKDAEIATGITISVIAPQNVRDSLNWGKLRNEHPEVEKFMKEKGIITQNFLKRVLSTNVLTREEITANSLERVYDQE